MNKHKLAFFAVLFQSALLMTGCGNDDSDNTDTDDDTNDGVCGDVEADGNELVLVLNDDHNYAFQSTLDIQSTRVKSQSDILFDWSGLTHDMLGNEIDPMLDIGLLGVVLWELTEAELMDKLNNDAWAMTDVTAPGMIYTYRAITSANYLDLLSAGGTPIGEKLLMEYADTTVFPPSQHAYSVMLSTGETIGQDAAMLAFFNLDPDETNTEVIITSDSTDLEYTVDMNSLQKAVIPPGTPDIIADWTDDIGTNALGLEFTPTSITEAMLAYYPSLTTEELETDFLHLEELAETIWRLEIPAGTRIELGLLVDESGDSFTGIDESGVWILALMCGACSNPAPWFLTVFETCEG